MSTNYVRGQAPYYDNFDEADGYSTVLYRPGRILQAPELNEAQSILKSNIKNIGDCILVDGEIIEGCQLVISDISESTKKSCIITAGRIYLKGNVRQIPETTVTIEGVGVQRIGVVLSQQVVTEVEDQKLKDPSTGFENYQQSGAHRLKEIVEIKVNDEKASTLFVVDDGVQIINDNSEESTVMEKINTTLARRTFDESGNYRVAGLELLSKKDTDADNIYLTLGEGKAYICGYEITKQTATTVPIKRATDKRNVSAESKLFSTGTALYPLNNAPVFAVNNVTATIQVSDNITRQGSLNGSDPLPIAHTPAVEIVSITQNSDRKSVV